MNTMAKPRKRASRLSATSRSSLYSTRYGRLYVGDATERLNQDPIARKKGKVHNKGLEDPNDILRLQQPAKKL